MVLGAKSASSFKDFSAGFELKTPISILFSVKRAYSRESSEGPEMFLTTGVSLFT